MLYPYISSTMTLATSFPIPQLHNTRGRGTTHLHIHIQTKSQSHHQNLHFLSISSTFSSSSSSFPLTIKPPSTPKTQFHLLSDSIHDKLIEDLDNSLNSHAPGNGVHQFEAPQSPSKIFIRDPPWISSLFLKGLYKKETDQEFRLVCKEIEKNKYNLLRRRQIKAETEAWERMVEEYRELEREMREKNLFPNLPHVKALFLGWFEPLKEAIEAEQKSQSFKKQKAAFAPHIDLLPPAKMAVIVMHRMMALVTLEHQAGCVLLVNAAVQIGMAVEQEVRIHKFLEKTRSHQSKKTEAGAEDSMNNDKIKLRKHVNGLIKRKRLKQVQMLLKKEEFSPWGRDTQAKLGSRLIELLIETAYVHSPVNQSADTPPDIRPAFRHRFKAVSKNPGLSIC